MVERFGLSLAALRYTTKPTTTVFPVMQNCEFWSLDNNKDYMRSAASR